MRVSLTFIFLLACHFLFSVQVFAEQGEKPEMKDASLKLDGLLDQFAKGEIDHIVLGAKFTELRDGYKKTGRA